MYIYFRNCNVQLLRQEKCNWLMQKEIHPCMWYSAFKLNLTWHGKQVVRTLLLGKGNMNDERRRLDANNLASYRASIIVQEMQRNPEKMRLLGILTSSMHPLKNKLTRPLPFLLRGCEHRNRGAFIWTLLMNMLNTTQFEGSNIPHICSVGLCQNPGDNPPACFV